MKNLFIPFLFFVTNIIAQHTDCLIKVKELQGTYEGECKKQKADGKGKAVGEDTYEGEFKEGFPNGTGKYSWKNGNWYTGSFKNGLRDGEGVMHFITQDAKDSSITGFWKKGNYIGLFEASFKVQSKTYMISTVYVDELKSVTMPFQIEIDLTSVSGGAASIGTPGGIIAKPVLSNILVSRGSYVGINAVTDSPKTNYYYIKDVIFPFTANFKIGMEEVVIDFNKPANYKVDISSRK